MPARHTKRKKYKKTAALKKRLRKITLALTVVFAVILTLFAIYAWHFFTRPFAKASSTLNNSGGWDGVSPINFAWVVVESLDNPTSKISDFFVISLNPSTNRVALIKISTENKIHFPKYGRIEVSNLYGLGSLPKAGPDAASGVDFTVKAASFVLGAKIHGYFLTDTGGVGKLNEIFSSPNSLKAYFYITNVTKLPRSFLLFSSHFKTNLSLKGMVRIIDFVRKTRSDKIKEFELTQALIDDPNYLDSVTYGFFTDKAIVDERLRVQVLNGAGVGGLAGYAARIINNMGGEVVRIGNAESQDLAKGFAVGDSQGSYTLKALAKTFGIEDFRKPSSNIEKRADVTVILGLEEAGEMLGTRF